MAKIRSISYRNEALSRPLETSVEYSSSIKDEKKFFVRLPDQYQSLWDQHRGLCDSWFTRGNHYTAAIGKTEDEAIRNFRTYMDAYFKATKSTEKVILYLFQYSSEKLYSDPEPSKYFNSENKEAGEISIEFEFKICDKIKFASKTNYLEVKSQKIVTTNTVNETGGHGDWIELPYTEENEKFFTDLYNAMRGLAGKFSRFMGTKSDILKTLESKQKLLV